MVREIEKRTVLEGMMIGSVCYRPDLQRALLNLPPEAEESVSTLRMVELIYNHRCQMQMRRGLFSSTHLPQVQACSEGGTGRTAGGVGGGGGGREPLGSEDSACLISSLDSIRSA